MSRHVESIINHEGLPLVIMSAEDVRGRWRDYLAPSAARALAAELVRCADEAETDARILRDRRIAALEAA